MSAESEMRRRPGRERLQRAVDRVFYRDGVSATSVEKLLSEADVARGTLYRNFATKEALLEEYLRARHESTMEVLRRIATANSTATEKIDAVFDYIEALTTDEIFRGCPFVLAAAEMSDSRSVPVLWARRHKQTVFETFVEMFSTVGVTQPSEMAERLSILYDGALVTRSVRPKCDAVSAARAMAHLALAHVSDKAP